MSFGSLCCLKNLNLWGCILPVEPLLSPSEHILFQNFSCHLALSQLLLSLQFIPSCAALLCTRVFCIVRLLILLLLAQAAISVPAVTAGTWVPVIGDIASETSKKFLFPRNNPLKLLGVCLCVMSTTEDDR